METTVNQGIEYTYNQSEINNIVNNTIDIIEKEVKNNNYQVNGKIQYYEFEHKNLSKRQMKRIQKYCYWIEKNPSLRRINTFFGLLSRTYGVERVRVNVSLKEQKIQKLRAEWLSARYTAENALSRYKAEKGDFYKK
jgi:hypothetical protein